MAKNLFGKFDKVLVANRGEIACRVFTACRSIGIKTVAVYSEADASALHVRSADESVCIGPGPAAESYLNIPKIIEAAKKTGAGAIHPGYGFLSERENFAQAVIDAGLIWIGPSPKVIELMGNKVAAKLAAEKAKVPTLPWAQLKDGWSVKDLKAAAEKVGFPLLLKAAAGGGGRGMRLIQEAGELEEKATAAMREAQGSFGSGEIFLESYCPIAKHIEVQLMGDSKGNVMIFGERDCSAQRRHQKVLEESPAPGLPENVRTALWTAAKSLASSVGYANAGTCEFLYDEKKKQFYFLEMNTRLQVEHPVSEIVWGVDLPVLQLKVAQGEAMPKEVLEASPRGHSIEARIYAEDPSKGYMPSPGKITDFYFPVSAGVRLDTGYETGSEVPIFYDAMLAKVIAWGMTREEARTKLLNTLEKSNVSGVLWNGKFLVDILKAPEFIKGSVYTKYLEEKFGTWKGAVRTEREGATETVATTPEKISPWFFYGSGKTGSIKKSSGKHTEEHALDPMQLAGGPLTSEYPGKVLKVGVKAGDKVAKDQVVVVCESMKMEYSYAAPKDTVVKTVNIQQGQIIQAGTVMVEWKD